jgi:hypothetical protein
MKHVFYATVGLLSLTACAGPEIWLRSGCVTFWLELPTLRVEVGSNSRMSGQPIYTAIASVLLSLVLTLFSARVSVAEVWMCTQPNGTTLYTDVPQGERSCDKFEPAAQLILLPPRIWATPPAPDVAYEKQEAAEAAARPARRAEDQTMVPFDAGESYNTQQDSFWSWGESPIFVYTYVSRFHGLTSSRHMGARDFLSHPRTQNGLRHNMPLWHQSVPFAAPRQGRETSVRPGNQSAQPQSISPAASSTHVRDGTLGTAPAVAPAPSSGFSPHMRR